MRRFLLIIISIIFLSCDGEDSKVKLVYSIVLKNDTNPFYEAFYNGCKDGMREHELSKEYDFVLDKQILESEDSTYFGNFFMNLINTANAGLIQGIAVYPINCSKTNNILNQAALSGTIVYTYENDASNSLRYSYFGADNLELGRRLAQKSIDLNNNITKMLIVAGVKNNESSNQILHGIRESFDKSSIGYDVIYSENDGNKLLMKIQNYLSTNQVHGFIFINNSIFQLDTDLEFINESQIVLSSGNSPKELEYLSLGKINSIITINPYQLGNQLFTSLINLSQFEKQPEDLNFVDLIEIDSSNLNYWANEWSEWLK